MPAALARHWCLKMLGRDRKYRTGSRWALWRWSDVDSEFITRLHLVMTPWFAVCLHWIRKPDPEPYLHDHPVTFFSLILRGRYLEERERVIWGDTDTLYLAKRVWWNFIRATPNDRHTIRACDPRTLTLAFMGPKVRNWGYHTPKGWVYWRDYYAAQRAERAARVPPDGRAIPPVVHPLRPGVAV